MVSVSGKPSGENHFRELRPWNRSTWGAAFTISIVFSLGLGADGLGVGVGEGPGIGAVPGGATCAAFSGSSVIWMFAGLGWMSPPEKTIAA